MKKLLNFLYIFLFTILSFSAISQQGMLSSEEDIIGEASEFLVGIHTGLFDCNQTVKYPYNIGFLAQYTYIPDVSKKLFIGAELGAFYVGSKEDDYFRKTQISLADATLYSGLSFPIGSNSFSGNSSQRKYKMANSRKFKMSLGFTVAIPLLKKSAGSRVNTDAIEPGIGVSLRSSYDLPNRLTIFGNATRIGKDMDGYSVLSPDSKEPSADNEYNATYYYKIGILWSFIGKY